MATSTQDAVGDMIAGASSDTYMPDKDDIGRYLHVMVSYRDGENMEDDPVTDFDERDDADGDGDDTEGDDDPDRVIFKRFPNAVQAMGSGGDGSTTTPDTAPMFEDASPVITVPENTPSTGYVGGRIVATDNGGEEGLEYEIGGPNASRFYLAELTAALTDAELYFNDINTNPGEVADDDRDSGKSQIAVAPVTHLDADDAANDTYRVEITATDAEGQRATAMVTIVVTNVNEAPSAPRGFSAAAVPMPQNTAPDFAATSTTFSMDENTTENTATGTLVGTVTATDADRPAQTLTYSLDDGADAGSFSIDSATGEITTSAMLDYETQGSYMVTVTATDDGDPAMSAMIYVTITVNDLGLDNAYDKNEDGAIDRDEVITAINAFLFGDGSTTRDDVIAVINLFLFS